MSRRILVADDSSTIQKVVKIAFSQYPVQITETGSYVEALHEVQRERPDVLILDACLPGANAPGDFLKLAQESGDAPVLLLIGSYQNVDESEFRNAGLEAFLKKPFDSVQIVEQVESMVGGLGSASEVGPTGTSVTQAPLHQTPPADQATKVSENPFGNPPTGTVKLADDPTRPPVSLSELGDPMEPDQDHGEFGEAESPAFALTEEGRRGRPAFDDPPVTNPQDEPSSLSSGTKNPHSTTVIIPPPPPLTNPAGAPCAVAETKAKEPLPPIPPETGEFSAAAPTRPRNPVAEEAPKLRAEDLEAMLPSLVQEAVENYCERHFKAVAREVITAELRRLADEKARHLVDQ